MAAQTEHDVIIVGAGIIGLATAQKLQEGGRRVTLIDRKGIARETSERNAGGLAFSDIMPLATAGMLSKVPRWLLDPLGPLTIPAGYFPRIFPWLLRFWRAGWPDRVEASIRAQAALMHLARDEMATTVSACGLEHMVNSDGSLELYESEAAFKAALPGWRRREAAGIPFEHVRGSRLAELQPGLSSRFVAGTFVPSWQSVADPYEFAKAIADDVLERGGGFIEANVTQVRPAEGGVTVDLTDGRQLTGNRAVIAAGAWSKPLAARLGDHIPLETERGYNTTLPPDAFDLRTFLVFGEHGFVISRLSSGIRVGGAVELGGLTRKPNYARADAMLKKAADFLPGLKTEGGTQWMGFRPSLPDTLPAIGFSRASRDIIYAFGHGHLGLTQSAATGRLIRDLITGAQPPIDLAPFSPQRF
ncbi:NAD(P)/FAD-dependent oxidoreductase [Dichotomicrobium thermohalophilum]|uniref:D-amino-acid dehydrogenase n=1 Tax=Dichotomicrobium thermohalophilum TaxID=933063 RepID=A0A397Q7A7_9HYPH|nr:FAD-binding oxidoreductase [Dichotomicrobium thermohalophilum]RIA56863.1 D-amino-acid dehydrogenase [Dichotomicrobium thermohalophilum]